MWFCTCFPNYILGGRFLFDMLIGIDPDVDKSGVAVVINKQLIECTTMHLWDLFEFIRSKKEAKFYVENSNLESGNWHGATSRENVGKNKAVSQIIVNFIKNEKYNLVELKPNGYSKVFKNEKIFEKVTKFEKRTSQDARAAACMIWNR